MARSLRSNERNVANAVFRNTIDFSNVIIEADTGLGGAFWVSPPIPFISPNFVMHMGRTRHNANPGIADSVFIHELTHVWQGQHGVPFEFVLNSGAHQGFSIVSTGNRNGAYEYGGAAEQRQWREYNVEQQARIVQDWFNPSMGNQRTSDWRFRYIYANIRPGNPYATSSPIVLPPSPPTATRLDRSGVFRTRFWRRR